MLKYFIVVVLFLILYQFVGYVIEGLEGDSTGEGDGEATAAAVTTSTTGDASPSSSSSGSSSGSSSSGGNCGMSLTDRNVFLLNDRVNSLQIQYTDLSGNMALLNKQMEDLMKQNENAASEMVGNEPLDISTGGNDMPQEVGTDTTDSSNTETTTAT